MRLALRVIERRVNGYLYYRVNIPKKVSDKLGIRKGSMILIDIVEVLNPSEDDSDA